MKKIIVFFLVSMIVLTACDRQTITQIAPDEIAGKAINVNGGTYTEISVAEFQPMLENKDFVLVNVHIPFEGDIPNTDVSIPYNEIEQHLAELPAEKDAKIILYCRSDRMSTIASETLVELGYTTIFNLDGGMVAWEKAGFKIEGK